MQGLCLGLTKTYNLFHCPSIGTRTYDAKQHKQKEWLTKHLAKTPEATLDLAAAEAGIAALRRLHYMMDEAVLEAYGWEAPSRPSPEGKETIQPLLDFHEVEYLPENDRLRYTLAPEVRKEVLRRLLALNHTRRAEEEVAGLWDDKKGKKVKKIEVAKEEDGQGSLF